MLTHEQSGLGITGEKVGDILPQLGVAIAIVRGGGCRQVGRKAVDNLLEEHTQSIEY